MSAKGARFTPGGVREGTAGHDVAYIHPKGNKENPISGNGALIELV
jgi:lactoylglutathione lyase